MEFQSNSPEETMQIAGNLIRRTQGRLIIALHGDLGTGKTCFVQGLAQALAIQVPVTSPTFTLIQEYPGLRPLYHIDLYRLPGAQALEDIGFEEYLARDAVIAIEWADRAPQALPPEATWHVSILNGAQATTRHIRMVPPPAPPPPATGA